MSIYDPLNQNLKSAVGDKLIVSFEQIEAILCRALPASAHKYQAWWSNEQADDTGHIQCRSWLSAGSRQAPTSVRD